MKRVVIISPAKSQRELTVLDSNVERPKTLSMARDVFKHIKPLTLEETKAMYSLSDKKAKEVWQMHQEHGKKLYYAIEMFSGQVFKELKLDEYDKDYLNEHVRIIDPLYGILKPYDTVGMYRLDFKVPFKFDLKEYWKDIVNKELEGCEIINLASVEYSSIVTHPMIDIELEEAKTIKQKRGKTLHKLLKNREI